MTFAIYTLIVLGGIFYVWRDINKEIAEIYKRISELANLNNRLSDLYIEGYKKLVILNETTERVLKDEIEKRDRI